MWTFTLGSQIIAGAILHAYFVLANLGKVRFSSQTNSLCVFFTSFALIIFSEYISLEILLFMVALLSGMYSSLRYGASRGSRWANRLALAAVLAYVAIWFVYKYPYDISRYVAWLQPFATYTSTFTEQFAFVGVSYIGFKVIHFYIDYREGNIRDASWASVLAWLFFVPSLVAGPIHRFQDWRVGCPDQAMIWENFAVAATRITIGLLKVVVISSALSNLSVATLSEYQITTVGVGTLAIGIVCYTIALYFNFSGYTDIAIGIGRLWNQRLPENFNYPFFRRNLQEFWQCWHMSLIAFLREYVYTRVAVAVSRADWFSPKSIGPAAIALLATFLAAAFWHKVNVGYAIWGLLNAAGLIFLVYLQRTKLAKSSWGRWWKTSGIGAVCGALLTFAFVNFSFLFIALDDQKLALLAKRVFGQ